jgi:CelD/BcsL family acetyltransferase involved in cellulose biosynthesis
MHIEELMTEMDDLVKSQKKCYRVGSIFMIKMKSDTKFFPYYLRWKYLTKASKIDFKTGVVTTKKEFGDIGETLYSQVLHNRVKSHLIPYFKDLEAKRRNIVKRKELALKTITEIGVILRAYKRQASALKAKEL